MLSLIKSLSFLQKTSLILLIFICGIFSFYRLGERPLERWDEQTNAWVVEQTINEKSFPILRYENKPFFEKPPLWYYSTIGIVKVFGFNNVSLRAVSAISNIILFILIILFCLEKFNYKVTLFSAITYLTTRHLFVSGPAGIFSTHYARSADLDLLQLLFIFITVWLCIEYESTKKLKLLFYAGLATGLGLMTKGVMSILPVLILMLWEIKENFKFKIQNLKFLTSGLLKKFLIFTIPFLLIVVPWHLFLYLEYGNRFVNEYLNYHYINRYVNAIEGHSEGLFFHIRNLLNFEFFSSGIILILGIIYLLVFKLKEFKYFMLGMYSFLILIIITIMQTKLAWYLLYIYPVGVIVCGVFYTVVFDKIRTKFLNVS